MVLPAHALAPGALTAVLRLLRGRPTELLLGVLIVGLFLFTPLDVDAAGAPWAVAEDTDRPE